MPSRTSDEKRWRAGVRDAAFGVWDLNPLLDQVHYSPQWKARLGFTGVDVPENTSFWRCRVHPADIDTMLYALRLHLDGSIGTYEARFRLRCNGSGYRTVVSRGRVIDRDAHGNARRMLGTMVDVTDRPPGLPQPNATPEPLARPVAARCLPFHAVLGAALVAPSAPERRLLGLVDDLLDTALREVRPNGAEGLGQKKAPRR